MLCTPIKIVYSFIAIKIPSALLFISHSHISSRIHWSFQGLSSFNFSGIPSVGIIKLIVFLDYLLSLSDICLRFLYIFRWFNTPFLFIPALYSIAMMYHSVFLHSPVEGHLLNYHE
jgi:hypothetical protein